MAFWAAVMARETFRAISAQPRIPNRIGVSADISGEAMEVVEMEETMSEG